MGVDTLLRALWLAGGEGGGGGGARGGGGEAALFDGALARALPRYAGMLAGARSWAAAGGSADAQAAGGGAAFDAALVASLAPPSRGRQVPPLTSWPLPTVSFAAFEASLGAWANGHGGGDGAGDIPLLARGSRYLLAALRSVARRGVDGHNATVGVPELASLATQSLVDALWATFFATGDPAAVERVLDAGTGYAEFLEEHGDAWVTKFRSGSVGGEGGGDAAPRDFTGVPPSLEDDPLASMRFSASRYALWSLLVNASTHTAVGDAVARHHDAVAELAAEGGREGMTAFGLRRLELLDALAPSLGALAEHAAAHGIGSGAWPESYQRGRGG
jgi:hypothetical protein